ncbi:MFS general substrate transporter [Armillaria mellea]|nr:MFS general substrate transporter [Armillaria mellea]
MSWEDDNDPENPKNLTYTQKWIATSLISTYTMLLLITSSMIAPNARDVSEHVLMHFSAFGPLFFGPASQIYGHSRVVQLDNMFYIIFNLVCAFSKTPGQMLAFQFLGWDWGVINDCWSVKECGHMITLYAFAPLFGPIIGPIAGAWITMKTTWKWIVSVTHISNICLFWLLAFALIILAHKARRLQQASSDEENVNYVMIHQHNPSRYVILTSIPDIFVIMYHENVRIARLHYIAFGIGLYCGAQITNVILDKFVSSGVHWIVLDIVSVFVIGIMVNWQAIQTYIIDTYTIHAMPALGGLSLLHSLISFALLLCSPSMYQHLGYGKGNTILASCTLGLGLPMVFILWLWGTSLHHKSATAIHS